MDVINYGFERSEIRRDIHIEALGILANESLVASVATEMTDAAAHEADVQLEAALHDTESYPHLSRRASNLGRFRQQLMVYSLNDRIARMQERSGELFSLYLDCDDEPQRSILWQHLVDYKYLTTIARQVRKTVSPSPSNKPKIPPTGNLERDTIKHHADRDIQLATS